MQPLEGKRCKQSSAGNGPRLVDGYERCNDCPDMLENSRLYECRQTGDEIAHPISGPVLMTCPRARLPEE